MPVSGQAPPGPSAALTPLAVLPAAADTRATFSLEASGGNMVEAIVDIRGCDFSSLDLTRKVLSGVRMQARRCSCLLEGAFQGGRRGGGQPGWLHLWWLRPAGFKAAHSSQDEGPSRVAKECMEGSVTHTAVAPGPQGSDFSGTKLVGVQFARAQAQGASLRGADLTDVNAFSTAFDGADLEVSWGRGPWAQCCPGRVAGVCWRRLCTGRRRPCCAAPAGCPVRECGAQQRDLWAVRGQVSGPLRSLVSVCNTI
jgi:uncharacterized protein YjbI with pentapeptide repeats